MRRLALLFAIIMLAAPLAAFAETWENAPLIDHNCLQKMKDHPDEHPTSCLIQCADSGYGILVNEGTWLKFDKAGNTKALAALKATERKDHIRVTVTGERKGDTITVESLKLD